MPIPKRGRKILISRIVGPTTSDRSVVNGLHESLVGGHGCVYLHGENGPMGEGSHAFGDSRVNIVGLTSEYQKKYLTEVRTVSICREDTLSAGGPHCWIPFGVSIT